MTDISDLSLCSDHKFAFFIGPRKTGTSWINAYLEAREDVATPQSTKETFFFDRYFERGTQWYEAQYPAPPSPNAVIAECAPSYAGDPQIVQRICNVVQDPQFIITLRNPVDRLQSHWRHLIRYGHAGTDPIEAMQPGSELLADSLYGDILNNTIKLAGAERVHVILYDQLQKAPDVFARAVCRSSGISERLPEPSSLKRQVNQAQKPRNRAVSAMAARVAEGLRNAGLHRVVRVARKAGLRSVLERPYDASETGLDEETKAVVREMLSTQMEMTASLIEAHPTLDPLHSPEDLARTIRSWAWAQDVQFRGAGSCEL